MQLSSDHAPGTGGTNMRTGVGRKGSFFTRMVATAALITFYFLAMAGIVTTGATPAVAYRGGRGSGRGVRGGRGVRHRGVRRGGVWLGSPYPYYDGCYWSPRRGPSVCPYYY